MWGKIQRPILPALIALLGVSLSVPPRAVSATMTVTNTLDAIIQANGSLSVPGATTLSHSGTLFASFTGSLTLQYRARTTSAGGGTVTLKVIQDFQAGGPSVSAGDLSYSCGSAGLGTGCTSATASTSSATTVVTLPSSACTGGGTPCSATDPDSVLVTFTLADRPAVQTGAYTANVQFTISAT
jgi:hypothetical protein